MSKSLFLQLNITLIQNNWRINNFFSSGKRILNFLNFTHSKKLLFLFSLSYFSFSRNKQLLENKKENTNLGPKLALWLGPDLASGRPRLSHARALPYRATTWA